MQPTFFDTLQTQGYTWVDDFWATHELTEMRLFYSDLQIAGKFRPGKVGHTVSPAYDPSQRTDTICWLDPAVPQTRRVIQKLENLRLSLNQELQLGAFRFETHFAHYPLGGKYQRHLDVHPSQVQVPGGRILSMITYLHTKWMKGMGGELMLYPGKEPVLIEPYSGRTVFFFSETMEHEVLESHFDRQSLACWFHRR